MTDDLAAFLRARLDDTAREALAAADGGSGSWLVRGGLEVCRTESIDLPGMQPHHRAVVAGAAPAQLHHIAENDPARVLAEVDAKRRIIDEAALVARLHDEAAARISEAWPHPDKADLDTWSRTHGEAPIYDGILRFLALPHREHPDYKPEWAPEGA